MRCSHLRRLTTPLSIRLASLMVRMQTLCKATQCSSVRRKPCTPSTRFLGNNGQPLSFVGLDLDTTGHLTFNSSEFQASISSNGFASVTQFLGDSSSGLIHAATSAVQNLEDPVTGTIKTEEKQMADSLTKMNTKINDEVDRINTFQQNLLTQLAQSDAAITQLENQATYFQNLFNTNNKNNN